MKTVNQLVLVTKLPG